MAYKPKYVSIKCSSFTIKAENGASQMTIHEQFVNTHAHTQILNNLLLKQVENRRDKKTPQKIVKINSVCSLSSFLIITPLEYPHSIVLSSQEPWLILVCHHLQSQKHHEDAACVGS